MDILFLFLFFVGFIAIRIFLDILGDKYFPWMFPERQAFRKEIKELKEKLAKYEGKS